MPPMFKGNLLWVNLSDGTLEERDVDSDLYRRRVGGASLLSCMTREGCIGLASGPLTGLPCPGASAAIACVESNRKHRFAPVMLDAGLELRLSGFDMVIVEGRSESPVYLWIRDQVADLVKADKIAERDSWETIASIRKEQGDQRIQVISSSKGASASLNFVSGWDGIGLGGAMREMNLKAIAFRGMGDIPLDNAEELLPRCTEMMRSASESMGGRAGVKSLLPQEAASRLKGVGRSRACYSCPYPCMSYAETGDAAHPGLLLMDQRSIIGLAKSPAQQDVVNTLVKLHRNGFCLKRDTEFTDGMLSDGTLAAQRECDSGAETFDTITEGVGEYDLIAAGYVLGLCPRYLSLIQPPLTSYCELLSVGLGETVSKEAILALGNALLREGRA